MSIRRFLFDGALRSAARRVARLWKPMAGWTVLVWAAVSAVLVPLTSAVLGWGLLRGDRLVVGNEELLEWLLTPLGVSYLLLAGGVALMGGVVRYAGLFRIVTDHMEGRPTTVRQVALELAPDLPALFRLCVAAVAVTVVVLIPLAAGLAGVHRIFLAEHDINYYLTVQPDEWGHALITAALWGGLWAAGAAYLGGRLLVALPTYLDGHRPIRAAVRRAWRRERGQVGRLLRLLVVSIGGWILVRMLVDGLYLATGGTLVGWVAAGFDSLRPVAAATGLLIAGSVLLDATVDFLGFCFVATVLTKFYHEETGLHAEAAPIPDIRTLPRRVAPAIRAWFRPVRLALVLVPLVGLSLAASGFILDRIPEARPVEVHAHRAGPPPSPENTLSALERSIEAGADYAEIDVQRTRDGRVVVVHDADLMRVARDPRRVAEVDYADIADLVQIPDDGSPPEERRVATLEDFLERADGRIGLNIELKYYGWDAGLAEEVVRLVRERDMEERVVYMSLSLESVRQLRRLAPDVPVGFVSAVAVGDLARLPVDFLAVAWPAVSPRLVRSARDREMAVHAWTVNRPHRMVDMIERGVDGIITDDPALTVRVREELAGLHPAERLLLRFGELILYDEEGGEDDHDPRSPGDEDEPPGGDTGVDPGAEAVEGGRDAPGSGEPARPGGAPQ